MRKKIGRHNIIITVDDDTYEWMQKFPWINWSTVIRMYLQSLKNKGELKVDLNVSDE